MKKYKFLVFTFFLTFSFLFLKGEVKGEPKETEIPTIRVETRAFGKIIIRVPEIDGPKEVSSKFSSLLRRLLNLHLFVLASPLKPFENNFSKEYYLKGKIIQKGDILEINLSLEDLGEKKEIKTYALKTDLTQLHQATYSLVDRIIEDISRYKGISSTKIAFVKRLRTGDQLYVSDFSRERVKLLRSAPLILFPKFSPSGEKLVYLVYEKGKYFIEVYDLKQGVTKNFFVRGLSSPVVWDKDETHLFLSVETQHKMGIYKFNLETQDLKLLLEGEGVYQVGDASKDGKKILYVFDKRTGKPDVYIFDLENGISRKISLTRGYNTSPRFSPKGDAVLYISRTGGISYIHIYSLVNGTEKRILFKGRLEDPVFSPTGDYILCFAEGPQGTGIYLIHLDSHLTTLYIPGKTFLFPAWTNL